MPSLTATDTFYTGNFELDITNFYDGYLAGSYKYNSATVIMGYMSYTEYIDTIKTISLISSSGNFVSGKFKVLGYV